MHSTLWLDDLIVTSTAVALNLTHLPLLQASHADIFTKEHIEGGINDFKHIVANEQNAIESFKDHADFRSCVPTVVAFSRRIRRVKTMAASARHGFQKPLTVGAEESVLWRMHVRWLRGRIEL